MAAAMRQICKGVVCPGRGKTFPPAMDRNAPYTLGTAVNPARYWER
jgi:hypothetical protein